MMCQVKGWKRRAIACAMLGGMGVFVTGCGSNVAPKAAPAPPTSVNGASATSGVPVALGTVEYAATPITVSAYGTIKGGDNSNAELSFMESGQIAQVYGSIGESVQRGQVLARLNTQPFEAQIALAQADLQAALANYSKAQLGARPQRQAQTSAQIVAAQVQAQIAQTQLSREKKLLVLGIAAQSEVDTARGALAAAQAQEEVSRQQYSLQARPLSQDVAVARAGVAQARAALLAARQTLVFATLVAPFPGVITARLHNDGESVTASMPILEIANEAKPVFTASFTARDAQRIHIGDAAVVHFDGAGSIQGYVAALNPEHAPGSHLVPVLIHLSSAPAGSANSFGPGAYGQASVKVGTSYGLLVPSSAVVNNPTTGSSLVFMRKADGNLPVPVTVERNVGTQTEIISPGLHAGDAVVKQGSFEL